MPAQLNLLFASIYRRLFRRRLFRSTPAAVIIVVLFIVIIVIGASARGWLAGKNAIVKPAPQQAHNQARAPRNNGNYIAPSRLWSPLRGVLNALGDRLEKPGKERLTIIGSLTRRNAASSAPFRLITELPNRMRLEEGVAPQQRVIGYDEEGEWAIGKNFDDADMEAIESLAFDTPERLLFGQMDGLAYRFLGERFRLDDGATKDYMGGFYDIYQVTDRIKIGSEIRERNKLFYVNSDTLLPERVRYQIARAGAKVDVEVIVASWQKVNGQQTPGLITRLENGKPVLTLKATSVAIGPRLPDGLFNNPQ